MATHRAVTVFAAAAVWLAILVFAKTRERYADIGNTPPVIAWGSTPAVVVVSGNGGAVAAAASGRRGGKAFSPEQLRPARGNKRVPPVVTKAGKRAFEVTYRKGERGGGSSNSAFLIAPPVFFPADRVRVSFKVWFDSSFPWTVNARTPAVGGKLGGFDIGEGSAAGGEFELGAASFRVTWKDGGSLLPYLYPATKKTYSDSASGKATWPLLDQSPGFQRVSRIDKGIHVFVDKGSKPLVMQKERWNDVSMYVKLNTLGKYDGVMELTVNGETKRSNEVRYRYTNIKVMGYLMNTFFGGSQRPPTDTKAWFADFEFSSQ